MTIDRNVTQPGTGLMRGVGPSQNRAVVAPDGVTRTVGPDGPRNITNAPFPSHRSTTVLPGITGSLVPRLTISGTSILSNGIPWIGRGLNWNEDAIAAEDGPLCAGLGANVVRCLIEFYYDAGSNCTTPIPNGNFDAYRWDQPQNGYLDPTILARLDAKVGAAVSAGMWVIIGMHGGDCDFGTKVQPNGETVIQHWLAAWRFLAARYKDTPLVAFYEPMSEPSPTNNQYDNSNTPPDLTHGKGPGAAWMYNQAGAQILAGDPRGLILGGPAKVYNLRNLEFLLPNIDSSLIGKFVVTANFYELGNQRGGFVKQLATYPPTTPYTGFPGTYTDTKGDQPTAGGSYPGKGQTVYMDEAWLSGLFAVVTTNRDAFQVPIFIQQWMGRTGTPGMMDYMKAVMRIFKAANCGWTAWVWRFGAATGAVPHGNDQGFMWQEPGKTGTWHAKDGANAATLHMNPDGTFGGQSTDNFIQALKDGLTA